MPRRVKQKPSLLTPMMDNFIKRLSGTNLRWRRKIVKYGSWIIGLLFFYSLMSGTYGIPRIISLELQKKALIENNQKDLIDLIDGAREKRMLLNDKYYIESIARTRYHMVYPHETIYRFLDK
ncbi:MAG: septum formation initiator family protein [FCB group bacterium]|nr:septum formation initiator family protein [FCB group bacterium]